MGIPYVGNGISRNDGIIGQCYLLFSAISLIAFYYAHAPWGIEKFFYLPCGLSLIFGLLYKKNIDDVDKILLIIIFLTVISDIVNGTYPTSFSSNSVRFFLGILCFYKLRDLSMWPIINGIALISPLIVISYYIFSNPFHYGPIRYGGFSGDPNYLAISLNLLVCINLIFIHSKKAIGFKILSIISIIGIIPLFIAGQSRAGISSLIILFLFYFIYLFRKSKTAFTTICLVCILSSGTIFVSFNKPIMGVVDRFSMKSKADRGGAMARFEQIDAAFEVFKNYPETIFFGTGMDCENITERFIEYRLKTKYIIHNTCISVFFSQGIFVLGLFVILFCKLLKKIKQGNYALIRIGLYLSLLINILSVSSINTLLIDYQIVSKSITYIKRCL